MVLVRLLLAMLVLALVPTPATAQQLISGSWALRVEGAVVFRFDLERTSEGWRGTWAKPGAFATDGAMFASLAGPPVEQRSQAGRVMGDWIELTFGDPRPGAVPDVFRFRLVAFDRVEMIYVDTGQAPYQLESVAPGTPPGPWEAGRIYRRAGVTAGELVRYGVVALPELVPTRPPPAAEPTGRPPAVIGR